ncbi:MAG: phosphatidylserine decarboxylase family protein [bacterium]|nr:phosphatidylserine decarboxylase family protein [bacterium]
MTIAKEAYPFLGVTALLIFISYVMGLNTATVIFNIIFLFICFFFRDPARITPEDSSAVFSPADGTIVDVKPVIYEGSKYNQVIIFLSVFNVHINRIPYAGKIMEAKYFSGKFHAAFKPGIEDKNERMETVIDTDKGKMKVVQIAGLIARRIVCRLKSGQDVVSGEKFGLIKFSSRTDIYIPSSAKILVKKGNKVKGGLTRLACFE